MTPLRNSITPSHVTRSAERLSSQAGVTVTPLADVGSAASPPTVLTPLSAVGPSSTVPCGGNCGPEGCRSAHCCVDEAPESVCARCGIREAQIMGRCESCWEMVLDDASWETWDGYDAEEEW